MKPIPISAAKRRKIGSAFAPIEIHFPSRVGYIAFGVS